MRAGPLHELLDLTGRVALVTGGSRGLGLQIAEALGEFGATLVLVARKDGELADAVAHLAARGVPARALAADLGVKAAAAAVIESVAAHEGRLDILINNAGATWGAAAEDHPQEGWDKVINLNVTALFMLTQAAAKRFFLPQGKGAVLNVASVEGLQAHPPSRVGTIAYNTSKGAVVNMTRALGAEWGPRNIRVNALAPGYFPTKMTATTLGKIGAEAIAGTPLGKLGSADDLKGAALLLASDAGGHITGQIIVVDGGATLI
ncbi:MAG: SDR family oxidoreductase [Steroidobacteraceae bacterium]|jgi:gluconate 5-dehydrogenase